LIKIKPQDKKKIGIRCAANFDIRNIEKETFVLGFNRVSALHVPLPMHHHIQDPDIRS
jgi:hypothetical protein